MDKQLRACQFISIYTALLHKFLQSVSIIYGMRNNTKQYEKSKFKEKKKKKSFQVK